MENEELSLDNILDVEDFDIIDDETEKQENTETTEEKSNEEDSLESVGSDEDILEEKEDTDHSDDGSSPNFYSSIAKALAEDGVFQDLSNEDLTINDAEDFANLIEQQIQSKFDARQKRIDDALNAQVEINTIKKYENTLNMLEDISDSALEAENSEGESLRKNLIYQDFINRGYSEARAQREVQKSINAGTDIEDAKEALKSNKEFFNDSYESLIKEAKEEENKLNAERKKQSEQLKKSILEDEKIYGELQVDKKTRQKVYDNISKPIYKDSQTGDYLTAIQKYQKENTSDFIKNVGLLYTLTDGFKNLDGLIKNKVRKEVKKGLKDLEHTLNNTARTSDGNLRFTSGLEDEESFIGKGYKLYLDN